MKKIATKITDLIGNTPLLELTKYDQAHQLKAKIIAKLEYFNPGGSVKDRISLAMIEDAEAKGILKPGTTLIEPTSGNTGIGLAMVAASKSYKLILTMPETMSIERRNMLKALGATLVLTPGKNGMRGAIEKAKELQNEMPGSVILQQFENAANPEVHRRTTFEEIWRDTDGEIDIFVVGIGTGGSITGIGELLKKKNKTIQIIAVEPFDSPVVSGGQPGPHKLQGIGPGFVPAILNTSVIDEIILVKTDESYQAARDLAQIEGLLVGISSGAALYAAKQIALRPENSGKRIVVILPDTGERYLSTDLFNYDEYPLENNNSHLGI